MADPIKPGDPLEVRDFHGNWLPAVARSGVESTRVGGVTGWDRPMIWVVLAARTEIEPWRAEDVRHPQPEEG